VATNVELVVGQKARLDFRLDLGTLAESVTVEAGAQPGRCDQRDHQERDEPISRGGL